MLYEALSLNQWTARKSPRAIFNFDKVKFIIFFSMDCAFGISKKFCLTQGCKIFFLYFLLEVLQF